MVSIESLIFFLILDVFLVNDYLVKKSSVRLNPGRQFFRALTVVYLVFGAAQHVAAQTPFVTTWQVDDISAPFVLPLQNHTPGNTYTIDWGDGSTDNTVYTETDTPTNLYTATGPYEISYSGNFTHLKFKDRSDLLGVVDWGSTQWTSMNKMFEGCSNFNQLPLEAPDLTFTENLSGMFRNATSFNQDISDWDVSNVKNMSSMFYKCSVFNQPIGNWGDKVANVTSMKDMFSHAHAFDQPLDSWDVGNVEDMRLLFNDAQRFNQDLNNWDVGNVKDMSYMFNKATSFNGNISAWVVDRVENMSRMFKECEFFDQPINNWVVSSVTDMSYMFAKASIFNQSIGEWAEKVGSVADMSYMFNDARRFNQPLDSWDVGNVENMSFMFKNARRFNQPIGRWNVTRVSDMREMFADAIQFNADLSGWDVRGVTNMQGMFSDAEAFNTDVSTWDVSSVTNMAGMFSSARSFNQDLGSWDIRAVTDMAGMFGGVTLSKANYDATITGWVETAAANSITLNSNVIFSGGNSKYCASEPERNDLINDLGWDITDGGKDCNDNDLITSYTLTTDGPICEGENATITMSGSQVDVQYQLRRDSDDFNVGEPIDGTGSELDFEITKPPVSANYHVLATNDETEAEIDNLAEITVNKRPSVILTYGAPTTQPDFNQQSPSISNSAMAAYVVFAADLDNDGDMDVLSASAGDNKIAWYENEGLGRFGAEQIISENANGANSVFAVDMDGDGNMDVLSALGNDHTIAWYKNTGGGATFTEQIIATNVQWASSVYAGDLDGDGHLDVLSVGPFSGVSWHKNMDGEGTSWSASTINSVGTPVAVSAADLDGDGDLDVLSTSFDTDKIDWYENKDGAGTFEDAQNITDAAPGTRSVFAVDIDGDGDMDVLSGSENGSKVAWHENADGMGTSWAEKDISTEAAKVASVYAADLDRDGDIDVLSASFDDDKIAWYENTDSEGTFGVQRIISTAADGANSVFAADLDGDGDIDVMSASRNDDMIAWYQNSLLVPQCEGDVQFNAISNATTPTWTWTTNGSAKINDNTSPNPIISDLVNGETVSVTVSKESCTNTSSAKLYINPLPEVTGISSSGPSTCGGNQGSITLEGLNPGDVYTVNYTFNTAPQAPVAITANASGEVIIPNLVQGDYTNITVTLDGCTSASYGPESLSDPELPTPADPAIVVCAENANPYDLTAHDIAVLDGETGSVAWFDGDPDVAGVAIADPANANLTTVADLWAQVTLTATSCVASIDATLTINPSPTPADPAIVVCAENANPYALTAHDIAVLDGETGSVAWFDGDPDVAGVAIADPANANLTTVADLWAQVTLTATSCVASIDATLTINPSPTPADPAIVVCAENANPYDLTAHDIAVLDGETGSVAWFDGDPEVAGVAIADPANANLTTVADLWAQVTLTATSCVANIDATLTINPTPIITLTAENDPAVCGVNGTIVLQTTHVSIGNYDIDYEDNLGNPLVFANVPVDAAGIATITAAAGEYFNLTITNTNGCTSAEDIDVQLEDPSAPVVSGVSSSGPSTCGGNQGSITLEGLNPGDVYTVNYTFNTAPQAPVAITANASGEVIIPNLVQGDYTNITVTLDGCTSASYGPESLSDPELPTPADPAIVVCAENANPYDLTAHDIAVLDGETGSVAWFDGDPDVAGVAIADPANANLTTVADLWAQVTLTATSCVASIDATLTINPSPTPADPAIVVCAENANPYALTAHDIAVLDGETGSVAWFDGDPDVAGVAIADPANANLTTVADLWAQVTLTATSCVASIDATLTINPSPTPADPAIVVCAENANPYDLTAHDIAVLDGETGSVAWFDGDPEVAGVAIADPANANLTTVADLWAQVTLTANSCVASIDATLTINPTPIITLTAENDPAVCGVNGTIVLQTTHVSIGNYDIDYEDNLGNPLVFANVPVDAAGIATITAAAGEYFNLTITNTNGCTSAEDIDVQLEDPSAPVVSGVSSSGPSTCGGNQGSITLEGLNPGDVYTVNYTFNTAPQAPVAITANASGEVIIPNLVQGDYTNITVTLDGCTSASYGPESLSDPELPTPADPAIVVCAENANPYDLTAHDIAVLDGETGSVAWFDGDPDAAGVAIADPTDVNLSGIGDLWARVTLDGSDCIADVDVTVTVNVNPTIALESSSGASTCGGTDGSFEISGLDVSTAYDIDYLDDGTLVTVNLTSDVAGVILVSGLDQGTYSAITATRVGCTSNAIGPVVLSDPATAEIALGAVSQPTTCGGTDGSFEITGLDINTTYEISYTDDGTDVTANMTSNGERSILVTDLNQGTYNNITATLSGCTSNAAGPVTLSDPGGECINEDFVTIWQVDDITTPFRLPKQGFLPEGKSYTIDWGDGTSDANTYTNVDVPTHSYSTSGAHQITYSGDFTQLRFEDRDDLLGVANWGNTQWTSMNSMFKGCSKFNNIPSTAPDLTFTNDLSNMLQGASSFNQSMANWDVSSITDMSALFYEAASFQGDISGWRVSNVTNMRAMFFRASAFDGDLSQWDVSQVEEMSYMFYNASAFAGDISSWNVSHVTDMSFMFYGAARFNGDLGNWNVANVTSMRSMFSSATNFPGGINNWNVSNVTDMRTMFSNAQSMSGSLDKWEVSSVTNMVAMFADALSFDGDIGSWDVASVVDMRNMFSGAEQFSSDISGWNVSAVSDMSHMFNGAIAFNADISDWNVFNVLDMTGMFNEASAFNRNLSGWCVGQINKEPTGFDAGTTAWTNPDWRPKWGVSCIPEGAFLSTWEVSEADLSVTVPVVPAVAYNYFVDWGDGYTSSRQTGNAVHTYSEAGTYTISIAGTFPRIYFNNRGDRNKIRFIDQWGDQRWSSMENAFAGCSKLQIAAVDAPNLKFVRNLRGMFKGATSLNSGLGHWDVSSATNMSDMFANTASFNGDVSEWNVGLVRDFSGMFRQATAFDQDLGNWDITNATKMDDMFEGVTLSTEHYDALLIGWAGLDAPPEGITFHGGSSTYCAGDDARKTLQLRHRWRITDGNRSTACILGIEGSLLSQVMLYPNPTQGIVHLQGWEEGKVRTVVIFDLSGRIVIKMDPSNQLNLEHLLEGTYILRLEGDQGLKTFKLIRN
jgi:surface protein